MVAEEVGQLRVEAEAALDAVNDQVGLAEWKAQYLGDKSALSGLLRGIGQLPKEGRPAAGQAINAAKHALEARLAEASGRVRTASLASTLDAERLDVTLPGRPRYVGRLHIITELARLIHAPRQRTASRR